MKYVSIDLKTTGVPGKDGPVEDLQIIEFGIIIEDCNNILPYNELPKFKRIIRHESYSGGAYEINVNQKVFAILAERDLIKKNLVNEYDEENSIITIKELGKEVYYFLAPHFGFYTDGYESSRTFLNPIKITVAGNNFTTLDKPFLDLVKSFNRYINIEERCIDPSILYTDFKKDEVVSNSWVCMDRAGVEMSSLYTNSAIEECWRVIQLLRPRYEK